MSVDEQQYNILGNWIAIDDKISTAMIFLVIAVIHSGLLYYPYKSARSEIILYRLPRYDHYTE